MNRKEADAITLRCREIKQQMLALDVARPERGTIITSALRDLAACVENLVRDNVRLDSVVSSMPINDGGRYS